MSKIYQGDTVRLKASFYNFAGALADPDAGTVTLRIYDAGRTLLETVANSSITKSSTGVYYYDYTTTAAGDLSYEFSGTLEGSTVLGRQMFEVEWV
jgi:hypothetical protein